MSDQHSQDTTHKQVITLLSKSNGGGEPVEGQNR